MHTAYECSKCGIKGFTPGVCTICGAITVAYEAGVPRTLGLGCRVPPPFKSHFSIIHGRNLESWSDYHKANRELGIVDTGRDSEVWTKYGKGRPLSQIEANQ